MLRVGHWLEREITMAKLLVAGGLSRPEERQLYPCVKENKPQLHSTFNTGFLQMHLIY